MGATVRVVVGVTFGVDVVSRELGDEVGTAVLGVCGTFRVVGEGVPSCRKSKEGLPVRLDEEGACVAVFGVAVGRKFGLLVGRYVMAWADFEGDKVISGSLVGDVVPSEMNIGVGPLEGGKVMTCVGRCVRLLAGGVGPFGTNAAFGALEGGNVESGV